MSLAVQVVFTGLSAGAVYGLIAIGHSLIYRLTGIVYFALGDLVGLGAFVTLLVAAGTQPLTQETVSAGRVTFAGVHFRSPPASRFCPPGAMSPCSSTTSPPAA